MEPLLIILLVAAAATSVAALAFPSDTRDAARKARRDERLAEQLGAWR